MRRVTQFLLASLLALTVSLAPAQASTFTTDGANPERVSALSVSHLKPVQITVKRLAKVLGEKEYETCGATGSGVKMCYRGTELCVAHYLVPTFQRYGATLGSCCREVPSVVSMPEGDTKAGKLKTTEPVMGLTEK